MKRSSVPFYFLSVLFAILSGVFAYLGYDKLTNYYSSENFSSLNQNAYVGGDAYNYIINGTYFSGFMAICAGCLIAATILFCFARYLGIKDSEAILQSSSNEQIQAKDNESPKLLEENNEGTKTFEG